MPATVLAPIVLSAIGVTATATTLAIATLAIRVVTTYVISNLFLRKQEQGGGSQQQQQVGNRVQLPPATNNQLPVFYGTAWMKAIITDAKISTDQKTMWYVCTLSDVPDGATISYGSTPTVMWGDKTLHFADDGFTVDEWTNDANETDTAVDGKMRVYLYSDGSGSPVNQFQSAITVLSDPRIAESQHWNYAGQNNLMTKTAFVIIAVDYDQEINLTGLSTVTVKMTNSLSAPGDCIQDYLTNTRYGCAIPLENIDTDSIAALNTYSNETIPVNNGGTTIQQKRYQFNGVIDPAADCATNLQAMTDCCDSWLQYNEATGKWKVVVNAPYDDISNLRLLNDDNIIGAIDFNPVDLNSTFNRVEASYPDTNIYDQASYTYVDLDDGDKNPNEPDNPLSLQLPFVNNYAGAYYLATRRLIQSREDLVVQLTTDASGIQIDAGDLVAVNNDKFEWDPKVFRVTQVVESKDGDYLSAKLTLTEYNEQVYQGITIDNFVPSPNTGITDPNIAQTPNPPTITNVIETATIPSFQINAIVPSNTSYQVLEFWYSTTPNVDETYQPLKTITPSGSSSFTGGQAVSYVVTGLTPSPNYGFICRVQTSTGTYSSFSTPPTILDWTPAIDVPTAAGTVFDWLPDTIVVPANAQGIVSQNGQRGAVQLRIGQSLVNVWNGTGVQPDNTWSANLLIRSTGLTTSSLSYDTANRWISFTVSDLTVDSATATLANTVYKPVGGNAVSIGTTAINVTKLRSGNAGANGSSAYAATLNNTSVTFSQNIDGTWPTTTQFANISYSNGRGTPLTKSQAVSVNSNGFIVFGANTGSPFVTSTVSGNGMVSGNVVFSVPSFSGLAPNIVVPVITQPIAVSASVNPPETLFPQILSGPSIGQYTPTTRYITATFTPLRGGIATTANVAATIAANGIINLSNVTVPTGVNVSFPANNSNITAVAFTHIPSGTQISAGAYTQITPVVVTDNYGGVKINFGTVGVVGNTVSKVAGSPTPIITYTAGTGPIFTRQSDSGNWTPAPNATGFINTTNTITVERNAVVIGRIAQNISYDTVTKTFTATPNTTGQINQSRFTPVGTVISSNTQYYSAYRYQDDTDPNINYGNAIAAFQVSVVEGGSRGSAGPVNVVRFARFASRSDAQLPQYRPNSNTGLSPTTRVAANNTWYRTPDVFPANSPYTHTSTQFISNVQSGEPWQSIVSFSGKSGGGYLDPQNEIYTITVANNHRTATFTGINTNFQVTGNSGTGVFPGDPGFESRAIVYGGGVGMQGFFMPIFNSSANIVLASSDGESWYRQTVNYTGFVPASGYLNTKSALFYNNRWRAVVRSTTGSLLAVSSDPSGLNWSIDQTLAPSYSAPVPNISSWIVNGNMVSVGNDGMLAWTSDGGPGTWNYQPLSVSFDLNWIGYFNGYYVLTADGSTWSQTGLNSSGWVQRVIAGPFTDGYITQSPGSIVFSPGSTSSVIYRTTDGVNFNQVNIATIGSINSIMYANGIFVANTGQGNIVTSTDGQSWSVRYMGSYRNSITYVNGIWYSYNQGSANTTAGSGGGSNIMYYSTDNGSTWTQRVLPAYITAPIVSGAARWVIPVGYVVAATGQLSGSVLVSSDGINWTLLPSTALSITPSLLYYANASGLDSALREFKPTVTVQTGLTDSVALTASLADALHRLEPTDPAGGANLLQVSVSSGVATITYKYTGSNATIPTFNIVNSQYANGANISNIVISTTSTGGGGPSVLVLDNVSLALNRIQLQITSAPVVAAGVYRWNVALPLTSSGRLLPNDAVVVDIQNTIMSALTEFEAVYSQSSSADKNIFYDTVNNTISLTPANYDAPVAAQLQALTTGGLIFIQGIATTTTTMTIPFTSNSDSNSQATQIASAFNTQEVSYTANAVGNVVTVTGSGYQNRADIVISSFSPSNGTAVLSDFVGNKTQDGRPEYSVTTGSPSVLTINKGNNFGSPGGASFITIPRAATWDGQNPLGANVQDIIKTGLESRGYYVFPVNSPPTAFRVIDIDPTSGGNLGISVNNGTGGTIQTTFTPVSSGLQEIVDGDPNRWTQPVNTGVQII